MVDGFHACRLFGKALHKASRKHRDETPTEMKHNIQLRNNANKEIQSKQENMKTEKKSRKKCKPQRSEAADAAAGRRIQNNAQFVKPPRFKINQSDGKSITSAAREHGKQIAEGSLAENIAKQQLTAIQEQAP